VTITANDFVPVQPYNTTVVTLGIGQQTNVVVKAIGNSTGAYWMWSKITCVNSDQPEAFAVIYYDKADATSVPKSTGQNYTPGFLNVSTKFSHRRAS
jgi:hypothetical protein